jgi:hypothetical protein
MSFRTYTRVDSVSKVDATFGQAQQEVVKEDLQKLKRLQINSATNKRESGPRFIIKLCYTFQYMLDDVEVFELYFRTMWHDRAVGLAIV